MKKRLDVGFVVLSSLVIALTIAVARVHAACTAVCPSGYTQTAGSCPTVHGNCTAKKCTGQITCSITNSSGTFTTNVPCTCQ